MPVKKSSVKILKPKTTDIREQELLDEEDEMHEDRQSSFDDVVSRIKAKEEEIPEAKIAAEKKRQQAVVESASNLDSNNVIRLMADLKIEISNHLDNLAEQLAAKRKNLQEVQEAIQIENRRLSELHDIEIAADTLSLLIRKHEEKTHVFDEELAERRKVFTEEMEKTKSEWEKKQLEHKETVREQEANVKKDREREQEEYEYELKLSRKRDEDAYKAQQAALQKSLAEQKAAQEKLLSEREAAIAAREKELVELRAQVDSFPVKLAEAERLAKEKATAQAKDQARITAEFKAKEYEGVSELFKQRIQTMENTIKEQSERIASLTVELADSNNKVREIAVRAIEGASGAKALSTVNEIALEQAKRLGGK
jgi:hypothetical protein